MIVERIWTGNAYRNPDLLADTATIEQVAGAEPTLQALLVVAGLALIVVVPPLVWLLRLVDRSSWN